jgi:nucleoside-diphosphate kinase
MTDTPFDETLVLIKPDALKLSLTGYILSQFSETHTGLRFAGAKIVHVHRMLAEEHYAEHKGKPFFPPLIEYLMGRSHYPDAPEKRRVVALVYSGPDAVKTVRRLTGPTNPHVAREQAPSTIRAMGSIVPVKDAAGSRIGERMDNLVHASATDVEAEREIKLWFKPNDIMPYMHSYAVTHSDAHYYFKDGKLTTEYATGSVCICAPGDTVWTSDLEALRLLIQGRPASCSRDAVIAKYLVNERPEQ